MLNNDTFILFVTYNARQ